MTLIVKIVEKDEKLNGDTLTLGFPDENGTILVLPNVGLMDMDSLEEGTQYALAFTPYTVTTATTVPVTPAVPTPAAPAPDPAVSADPTAAQGDSLGL